MGLSGKRTKEIVEAINSAFIDRNKLVMMLDYELNINAANLLDNSTYDVTVYNLVKQLDSLGRIKELIEGARRGNPGNPDLILVHKKLYHPLSGFFYEKIIPILESIDFEICKKICYEILPRDARIHLDDFRKFRDINSWLVYLKS
ncbi:hypothetical protein F7734_47135 [Scytonema sp. UIC 10036]|uniref:effector-associated domain EAD1-containing protein n=1 Tax=Scytonema sp. UIC 10036 TaxID=2304196 RepID=UPI0012DA5CB5|nr:effector-associated domain EAD1-containing protein [Scytonema sp. UIC 10036]MUG99464.1 hypothetical protein [Scytonema sp. UIC 10036]